MTLDSALISILQPLVRLLLIFLLCKPFRQGLGELVELKWLDANCEMFIEQTEKVIPLFTNEMTLCEDVGKLVLGVNIFDFGFVGPN